jgi:hypothetical protein
MRTPLSSLPVAGWRRCASLRLTLMLVWLMTWVIGSWYPAQAATGVPDCGAGIGAVAQVTPMVAGVATPPAVLAETPAAAAERMDLDTLDDEDGDSLVPVVHRHSPPALSEIQPRAPCLALWSCHSRDHNPRAPPLA